jgi:hypothetical protein
MFVDRPTISNKFAPQTVSFCAALRGRLHLTPPCDKSVRPQPFRRGQIAGTGLPDEGRGLSAASTERLESAPLCARGQRTRPTIEVFIRDVFGAVELVEGNRTVGNSFFCPSRRRPTTSHPVTVPRTAGLLHGAPCARKILPASNALHPVLTDLSFPLRNVNSKSFSARRAGEASPRRGRHR